MINTKSNRTFKGKSCCVGTCLNTSKDKPHLAYYSLPGKEPRRSQWLLAIGREDLMTMNIEHHHYTVCEEHFDSDVLIEINGVKRLINTFPPLLPTLHLPKSKIIDGEPATILTNTIGTQATLFSEEILKNIEKYKEANKTTRNILAPELKSKLLELSKTYAPYEMQEIIKCFETLSTTPVDSDLYKIHCFNLYSRNPNIYQLLQSVIDLPAPHSLLNNAPITTDINERLLSMISSKVAQMTTNDVQCMAVVDSMPLNPHLSYNETKDKIEGFEEINGNQESFLAERALVVMLQGLITNWRLPVSYALLRNVSTKDDNFPKWLNTLLTKLYNMGLIIRTLSFVSAFEAEYFEQNWTESTDAPYFFIKKQKVYIISDMKTLSNVLRNEFRVNDIIYDSGVAKYEHIETFFNRDKNNPCRLAPKLTEAHIYSSGKDACASEIFTKTVASGISTYIDSKLITENAKTTVQLIDKISEIINLLNSTNHPKEIYRSIMQPVGDHMQITSQLHNQSLMESLANMQAFANNLKMVHSDREQDITDSSKFIRGILLSLNACISLFKDLETDIANHKPIKIQNQGTSDEFFKQIRLKCKGSAKPTATQFMTAYTQLFVIGLYLKPEFKEINYRSFFAASKKSDVLKPSATLPQTSKNALWGQNISKDDIKFSMTDFNHIDRAERNSSMYVSAFLLKKCRDHHWYCDKFKSYVEGTSDHITINHLSRYLHYSQKHQICFRAIPCNHFIIIVEKMEEIFRKCTRTSILKLGLDRFQYEMMKASSNMDFGLPPCPCFPWRYLMKLFYRMRINYTVNINNREYLRGQRSFVIPLLLPESYSVKIGL